MSFSSVINLGTVSPAITQVKLYECTGDNTGCTALTGYNAVDVNTFPITVSGINENSNYIKVEALGTCAGTIQSLLISGKPGTPTPTPTGTPTPTPTVTPTPTATTTSQTMVWNLYYPCDTTNNATQVIAYSSNYSGGEIIKGSNGNCYTIAVTGYTMDTPITVSSEHSTCEDCEANQGPEPITFSVTPSCVGYAPTGVTITINNASGGSGTGYYVKMTSPSGNDTPHNLPYSYTGLDNYVGNTYAFTVYDSEDTPSGNYALTQDFSCAAAPNNTVTAGFYIGSTAPNSTACGNASTYQFELNSPAATFCNATTFTTSNTSLRDLGTGNNFWLCYEGQTRQLYHSSNSYTFTQAGPCQTIITGF